MSEKGKCIIAYLLGWIGGVIVLFGMKDNEKNTRFHAAQSIVLSVGYIIITSISGFMNIPMITPIMGILFILGMIMGIVKANKGEDPELPLIGNIAKSIFAKKIEEN